MNLSVNSLVASWCSETPGCRGNLGVPRSQMPQIKPEFRAQFFVWVRSKYGAKTDMRQWKARELAATQKEIDVRRVESLLKTGRSFMRATPMIVSKDGFVLDGHHRWAATLKLDPDEKITTYTVDLPIRQLLKAASEFPNVKVSPLGFNPEEVKKARATFSRTAAAAVTPVRQRTQYTCMATSMMMCLQANGTECDEDEVNRVMGARAMQGAAWEDALACAQHYGMRSTLVCPATVRQLKEFTDRGVPVMIAWNPEGREWSHASVVFDVDDDLNVYVADPNIPDPDETVRVVPKGEFYKKWAEKWPNYLVRRPAMAVEREITTDGRQVVAHGSAQRSLIQSIAAQMGSRMARQKTGSDMEQAISKLHPEMAKAVASSISGGQARKDDFWASTVSLPRDIAHGMYLQMGSQDHPKTGGMSAYVSVWTPIMSSDEDWRPLYDDIADALKKLKSAMGRFGKVTVHDVGKAVKVWLEVPANKITDAIQGLPAAVKRVGGEINALLKKAGRTAATETTMSTSADNYPPIHPAVEAMFRQAKPSLSKDDIEKALKGAGLKFKYVATDGGSFLVSGLGPMMSDAVDIELDHKGGAPKDATAWKVNFKNKTMKLESRSDLSRAVSELQKLKDAWESKMQSKKATDQLWAGLGDVHPEVARMFLAKKAEDDDKDADDDKKGKFERGEDVPLSEMPKELAENAKDPPPAAKKLKEKLKKKANWPESFGLMLDVGDTAPATGTIIEADDQHYQVVQASLEHFEDQGECLYVRLRKTAAQTPGGLYGLPKKVQTDCEAAARKLQRVALKLAAEAVKRDGKVASFWADRAKKAKSGTARMLLAALEANQKFAAERGETVEMGIDKEAAGGFGYYGYRAKTASRAFSACQALKEAAGEIGAELHARRAGEHERISAFLTEHSKKAKCAASKMILHGYPEASSKVASVTVEDPNSVAQWLAFEGD